MVRENLCVLTVKLSSQNNAEGHKVECFFEGHTTVNQRSSSTKVLINLVVGCFFHLMAAVSTIFSYKFIKKGEITAYQKCL